MPRFYIPPSNELIENTQVELSGPEIKHITRVLRLQPGHRVELFDGQGGLYQATLEHTEKNRIIASIQGKEQAPRPTSPPIVLLQALLKGKKMDFLIQKATELGIEYFFPVITTYCENHGQRAKQQARWQRIMIESCKQCQRLYPMQIMEACSVADLDMHPIVQATKQRFVAWEQEKSTPLPFSLRAHQEGSIGIFIGPEGGLHEQEIALLQSQSFLPFSLGPLILRGETASITAMSIVAYLTGGLAPVHSTS